MQYLNFGNDDKFLVVRAILGKNLLIHVSIFFVVCQDCIETRPTLIWMILIAPCKQEIYYKIIAVTLMMKIRDNTMIARLFKQKIFRTKVYQKHQTI